MKKHLILPSDNALKPSPWSESWSSPLGMDVRDRQSHSPSKLSDIANTGADRIGKLSSGQMWLSLVEGED